MTRWFRHYAGMMRDEKLVRAAVRANQPVERVIWVWGAILESAAEINDGGRYDLDASEVAYFLRTSDVDIMGIVTALEDLGRLCGGCVAKWGERQYQSDSSATRQKAYRDRQKDKSDDVVQDAAVTVTASDRHSNNEVTPTSVSVSSSVSDKRTEKEKITDEFQELYDAYPLHKGRGAAQRAHKTARTKAEHSVLLNAIKAFAKKCAGTDPKYIPHPATWFNQDRWLDEDLQPPKPQEPTSNGGVYVTYGTEPGDAWERDYRGRGKIPPRDARGGWYHPSEYPEQNVKRETTEAA
jgi:hypothetical protein